MHGSIDPLQNQPEPTAVVRSSQDQDSPRAKDSPHLGQDLRPIRDMLDHFRVDESGKTAVTEREAVAASSDQRAMASAQPSQFILKNIQPHRGWQVHDRSAGATPDVQEILTLL